MALFLREELVPDICVQNEVEELISVSDFNVLREDAFLHLVLLGFLGRVV